MAIAAQVVNLRPGPFGSALAYFNVVVGEEGEDGEFVGALVLKDFVLKEKKDGSSKYWQSPAKQRLRNGAPVKDPKGFAVWDDYISLFAEEGSSATPLAFKLRTSIIEQATALFDNAGKATSGRGGKPAAAAPAKKTVARKAAPAPVADAEELDDDLPF